MKQISTLPHQEINHYTNNAFCSRNKYLSLISRLILRQDIPLLSKYHYYYYSCQDNLHERFQEIWPRIHPYRHGLTNTGSPRDIRLVPVAKSTSDVNTVHCLN